MKIIYLNLLPFILFAYDISIKVQAIESLEGSIYIGLYKTAQTFASTTQYVKSHNSNIVTKKVEHTFRNIPSGTYAIAVFHDKNKNGKLDKNFLGIPKEGYGFSNNPKVGFSQPTFQQSSFELNSDKTIIINMGY